MTNTKKVPRSSENTTQGKHHNLAPGHIIFKLQKIRDKEKILKEARGEEILFIKEQEKD